MKNLLRACLMVALVQFAIGCGPQEVKETSTTNGHSQTQTKPAPTKPAKHADDEMTEVEFQSIKVGEPLGALKEIFPHIKDDENASGDSTFKAVDHRGVYVIRYGCRADSTPDDQETLGCIPSDQIVVEKNYFEKAS